MSDNVVRFDLHRKYRHNFVDRVCTRCGVRHESVWVRADDGRPIYGYNTALTECVPLVVEEARRLMAEAKR